MAGTILVGRNRGIALNSIGYHAILERVRIHLDSDAEIATKSVFEPNDLEGMTFISLVDADAATFRQFQRAAIAAYIQASEEQQTFQEWDELMQVLRSDPRSCAD